MRKIALIILIILSLIVIRLNFKLHSENYSTEEAKDDIILQLNFLESELKDNNLGSRMQQIFPEGLVFVNALYGLSWCELALSDLNDDSLKKRAIDEALFAFNNIDTDKAKWNFPKNLKLEYGIFYNAWRNYLLSKIFSVDSTFNNSEFYFNKLQHQSNQILNAFESQQCPYLESYEQQSWPADNFIAIASLANYDKVFDSRYEDFINLWIKKVKVKLDPEILIIPHKVNSNNAQSVQGARGSSTVLILRMLGEIDKEFGKEQYELFKKNFVSKTFGLPTIREYSIGQKGVGDIDSGPVIYGVGFSATIVSIGTFALFGDYNLSQQQYKAIHALGFSYSTKTEKKYIYGKLPIADAFIAWGRATALNYKPYLKDSFTLFWRFKFHLYSVLLLIIIWSMYYWKLIYHKIRV